MSDIQSLIAEIQRLNDSIGWWNKWVIGAMAITAIAATVLVLAQKNVIRESRSLSAAQDRLGRAKDDAVSKELAEKGVLIARSNERTEQLRAENLELQKIMQPRRLGSLVRFSSFDEPDEPPAATQQFEHIKQFAGTPVLIQVVPDFEAQTLANDLVMVVRNFGWKPEVMTEAQSHLSSRAIMDGLQITWPHNSKFSKAAQALADGLNNAGITGSVATNASTGERIPMRVFAQGYPVKPDGTPVTDSPGYPRFDKPIDAVIVLIGMKPIPPVEAELLEVKRKMAPRSSRFPRLYRRGSQLIASGARPTS